MIQFPSSTKEHPLFIDLTTHRRRAQTWLTRPLTVSFGAGVLTITEKRGNKYVCVGYYAKPIKTDFGQGFELTKFQVDGGEVYQVLLDGQDSRCTCIGFEAHSHCKHICSLQAVQDQPEPDKPNDDPFRRDPFHRLPAA
jgi:hypothetical protein